MSIARIRIWDAGDILTAAALNLEIQNLADKVGDITVATVVSGAWTFSVAIPIASGGTGAVTVAAVRTAFAIIEADGPSKLSVAGTAPSSPSTDDLWLDTS